MTDENDIYAICGSDAAKWAAEFRKTAIRLGYSDMDEGWLIGWFANAIEHSYDIRHAAAPAPQTEDDPRREISALRTAGVSLMDRAEKAESEAAALRTALTDLVSQVLEYERNNNLAPNPGRKYCWDATERAVAALASTSKPAEKEKG